MNDLTTPITTHPDNVLRADWTALHTAPLKTTISSHDRQGLKLVEQFQPHIWNVEGPTGQSIAKHWDNPVLRAKAEERTAKHYKTIYKSEIRRNLAFFSKAPLPTIYRPLLTKGIVSATNSLRVLDCSIGWGGRLLGTLALPNTTFEGCEPCVATYTGLTEMSAFLGLTERVVLHNAPAETILPTLPSATYDLMITSPPYFDLEVYSHEPTQSIKTFPSWEEWCEGFLAPVLHECLRCLKPSGVSAWSVKNMAWYGLRDKVVELHEAQNWRLSEVVGMRSTPRNTGKSAILTEETLMFRKSD